MLLALERMKSKVCTLCGVEKPVDEYHKRPERPVGVKSKCKSCCNKARKTAYKKDRASGSLRETIWVRQGIVITFAEYSERFAELNGCCEICSDRLDTLCVDHDHLTGQIRGLLCTPCNLAIENLKESVSIMENAILYMKKYGGRNV